MHWIRSQTVGSLLFPGVIVRLLADRHLPRQMTKRGTKSWPTQGKIGKCGRSRKRGEIANSGHGPQSHRPQRPLQAAMVIA